MRLWVSYHLWQFLFSAFKEVLPSIYELIDKADFIAIDAEMTGLRRSDCRYNELDSLEERLVESGQNEYGATSLLYCIWYLQIWQSVIMTTAFLEHVIIIECAVLHVLINITDTSRFGIRPEILGWFSLDSQPSDMKKKMPREYVGGMIIIVIFVCTVLWCDIWNTVWCIWLAFTLTLLLVMQ